MDIPPKAMKDDLARRDRGLARSSRDRALAGSADSLPVLDAFRKFLDAERRRARNRMLGLIAVFVLFLLVLCASAFFGGSVVYSRLQNRLLSLDLALEDARADASRDAEETRSAFDRIREEARNLRDNLAQQERAVAVTRTEIENRGTEEARELADMRALIESRRVENTALKQDLALLNAQWPAMVSKVDRLLGEIEAFRAAAASVPAPKPDPPPKAGQGASLETALRIPGVNRPIAWRTPIPE